MRERRSRDPGTMTRIAAIGLASCWILGCGTGSGTPARDPGPADPGIRDAAGPAELPADLGEDRDPGPGDGKDTQAEDAQPTDPGREEAADVPPTGDGAGEDPASGMDPGSDSSTPEATDSATVEVPGEDPGADVPSPDGLEPWSQCSEDSECQAIFGPAAWCNHDFPGGQCAGCDPYDLGHERCTLLGKTGLTLSCKETVPNVCLFDPTSTVFDGSGAAPPHRTLFWHRTVREMRCHKRPPTGLAIVAMVPAQV